MSRAVRLLLVSLLALASAACGEAVPPTVERATIPLQAGPATDGLRLSARVDALRGLVRYEVENVGEVAVSYARGHMGHAVEARRRDETAWTELPLVPGAIRFVSGMGPSAADVRALEPGARLPADAFWSTLAQHRYTPAGEPRDGLEVPRARETFTLDLLDHVWPASLGDLRVGVIELRVVQVFPDWSELLSVPVRVGRLPSAVLELDPADLPGAVRAAISRAAPD